MTTQQRRRTGSRLPRTPESRVAVERALERPESVATPAHDDVARRAYQLYLERGGENGRDLEDWFRAERELEEQAASGVVETFQRDESVQAVA